MLKLLLSDSSSSILVCPLGIMADAKIIGGLQGYILIESNVLLVLLSRTCRDGLLATDRMALHHLGC